MNKPVEQALTSLVPSLSGPLPPELVGLAVSLLAQSRSKASSLKPEEEIARIYACAHLACERLKQRLNLPQIEPRPPAPPRIYKKVFTYFSTALAPQPARTLNKQNTTDGRTTPASTPAKSRTLAKGTPSKANPWKGNILDREHGTTEEPPDWVMPATRQLCKAFDAPAAAPHVFVGVSSVLLFQRTQRSQTQPPTATPSIVPSRTRASRAASSNDSASQSFVIEEPRIPALIAVIFFYTLTRLSGEETTPKQYLQQRQTAITTLNSLSIKQLPSEEELITDVEVFMREAQKGWLELEWYQNIPEGGGLKSQYTQNSEMPDQNSEYKVIDNDDIEGTSVSSRKRRAVTKSEPSVPRSGLGTMMCDSIDWLSVERRTDYIKWKAGIMARIEIMERERSTAMDTST